MSNQGTNSPKRRADLFRTTGGRCFYCGIHVRLADEPLQRDWLVPRNALNLRMVPEHALPISRGGTDYVANIVPSCFVCNARKGSLTLLEYDLWVGIRDYDLNAGIWGLTPQAPRDWLCSYSEPSVIFKYNRPDAAVAFGRGKIATT
jgi:hypothetical protein